MIWSHFRTFAEETTTHGVAQLVKEGAKLRVIVYALALLAGTTFLVYSFSLTVRSFIQGETYTNIEIQKKPSQDFPSLTVCPNIKYTKSALQRHYPDINVTEAHQSLIFNDNIFSLNLPGATTMPRREFIKMLSVRSNETFTHCHFGNYTTINCSDLISDLDLDVGACFSINSLVTVQRNGVMTSDRVGRKGGFAIYVDAQPDDELLTSEYMTGFELYIHSVEKYPGKLSIEKSKYLAPGFTYNIALRKEVYKTLPAPYSTEDCYYQEDKSGVYAEYAGGFPYTDDACRLRCSEDWYWETCGCKKIDGEGEELCSFAQLRGCRSEGLDEVDACYETCLHTCNYVNYVTSISSGVFPNERAVQQAISQNFPAQTYEEIHRRILKLNIYFETFDETHITQHARYSPSDIFSTIGGLMGLCLGVSLISVLELCEFLFKLSTIRCRKQKGVFPNHENPNAVIEMQ